MERGPGAGSAEPGRQILKPWVLESRILSAEERLLQMSAPNSASKVELQSEKEKKEPVVNQPLADILAGAFALPV